MFRLSRKGAALLAQQIEAIQMQCDAAIANLLEEMDRRGMDNPEDRAKSVKNMRACFAILTKQHCANFHEAARRHCETLLREQRRGVLN